MSEELMAMIESLVQEHYGTQGLEYLRQRTRPAPAVQVPEGFSASVLEDAWCHAVPLTRPHFDRFMAVCREMAAAPAPAPVATVARCDTCDGTGDVHDATGEWRGRCPHCAPAPVATEAVAQVGGVDVLCHFDAAVDAAKILGRADAAREYGCYTEEKSRIERAMYEIIAKHRRALLTAAPAIANQEARDGR